MLRLSHDQQTALKPPHIRLFFVLAALSCYLVRELGKSFHDRSGSLHFIVVLIRFPGLVSDYLILIIKGFLMITPRTFHDEPEFSSLFPRSKEPDCRDC